MSAIMNQQPNTKLCSKFTRICERPSFPNASVGNPRPGDFLDSRQRHSGMTAVCDAGGIVNLKAGRIEELGGEVALSLCSLTIFSTCRPTPPYLRSVLQTPVRHMLRQGFMI